jgi:kumamolisin
MQTEVVRGHCLTDWLAEEGWKTARPERVIHGVVVFRPARWEEARQAAEAPGQPRRGRDETDLLYAPDPQVVVRLAAYLEASGLTVSPPAARGLYLDFVGTVDAVGRAFRCTFAEKPLEGRVAYLNRDEPQVPPWAVPHVLAILGLENRSRLHPLHRYPSGAASPANAGQGYFPRDLRSAYRYPADLDGSGQTIGVLEFSNGYNPADLTAFWTTHGITPPSVVFVSVDGTPNDGGTASVDMECTLDVEWAGAMAPGALIVVYEAGAGGNDVAFAVSMQKALEAVVADEVHRPSVVSISYGDAETHFPASALKAWDLAMERAAARGITVCVASGDEGAYGVQGEGRPIRHCDAPASLPHALGVGGTTLTLTPALTRATEVAWTDTNNNGASGGGVSVVFPLPPWQDGAGVPPSPAGLPGRGVPDVALNADPDTGYNVVFQGQSTVVGGTSAAAPMWAALLAAANQARASRGLGPLGFVTPLLYRHGTGPAFHDIVSGNNTFEGVTGYSAGPGWDPVTGWGSVDGTALVELLAGS